MKEIYKKIEILNLKYEPESIPIPFELKRVYWIFNVPENTIRGTHAHRNCEEIIYVLEGHVEVRLIDKKGNIEELNLFSGEYLYIPIMVWKAIKFYNNTKLVVYASTEYDVDDYIYEKEFFE